MTCAANAGYACELVSLGAFLDRSDKVGAVEVRQCRHCGHGVTFPPLADVAFLYGDRESQDYQPDTRNTLARRIKDIAFRRQARTLLRQIGNPGAQALDFGCGSGQFTRVMGELIPATRLTGSDFFDAPPPDLAGRPYAHSDVIAQQPDRYDLIMAMHVLEHDDDVDGLLARIVRPARSGGTVVIEVPNIECFWGKVFGRFWDAWYLPFHRSHFSRRSLTALLRRHGLEITAVHGLTVPTMGRTAANLFGRRNNLFWLLIGIALHPLQLLGEALSGQKTVIRVIARKR
ncbi:MAG: class I SAM-dependent methyltransferase [Pseudomonadota bacterium]